MATKKKLINASDHVMTAGSCFATNLVPWLERTGIEYVRTELPPAPLAHLPENLGYRSFSAAYGNIYTTRHLLQLIQRALGEFVPEEDRWTDGPFVIDPFRPGLKYPPRSDEEFDLLTRQHLDAVLAALRKASVFVFTLGLTEAWTSKLDGATYPACPGTISGAFDPERYEFMNFSVDEVTDDLMEAISLIRTINPELRIVLTVSPVPLVATATDRHVLHATTYSKAVLRVAAEHASNSLLNVDYFTAYEIITGPQAPDYYEPDHREVTQEGVRVVMEALFADFIDDLDGDEQDEAASSLAHKANETSLSQAVSQAECDEVMMDWLPEGSKEV